jgi:uncharacterized membrane protein
MFSIILRIVLSWILFPIGLFKSGLSLRGYALIDDIPTWKSMLNLGLGLLTAYISLSYVSEVQGYGKNAFSRFSELDLSKMSLTDPFVEYVEFFPWVVKKASLNVDALMYYMGLADMTLMGVAMTPGLLLLTVLGSIVSTILLVILFFEIRIRRQRKRHQRFERRMIPYAKKFRELSAKYPGELTDEQEVEIAKLCSAHIAHIKDPGPWKKMYGPITGNYQHPSKIYGWQVDDFLFNAFFFIEGLITPVITAAYAVIFFIPTLLIIGIWLFAIVALLVAFMPFAWLYGNGMRVRLH